MKILYFSWIKDKLGKSEENIILHEQIKTVEQLVFFYKIKMIFIRIYLRIIKLLKFL